MLNRIFASGNYKWLMRRLFIFTILALAWALQSHAVLKEKDLDNTLGILRTELTKHHAELERQSGFMREQQAQIRKNLFTVLNRSNQNAGPRR